MAKVPSHMVPPRPPPAELPGGVRGGPTRPPITADLSNLDEFILFHVRRMRPGADVTISRPNGPSGKIVITIEPK